MPRQQRHPAVDCKPSFLLADLVRGAARASRAPVHLVRGADRDASRRVVSSLTPAGTRPLRAGGEQADADRDAGGQLEPWRPAPLPPFRRLGRRAHPLGAHVVGGCFALDAVPHPRGDAARGCAGRAPPCRGIRGSDASPAFPGRGAGRGGARRSRDREARWRRLPARRRREMCSRGSWFLRVRPWRGLSKDQAASAVPPPVQAGTSRSSVAAAPRKHTRPRSVVP